MSIANSEKGKSISIFKSHNEITTGVKLPNLVGYPSAFEARNLPSQNTLELSFDILFFFYTKSASLFSLTNSSGGTNVRNAKLQSASTTFSQLRLFFSTPINQTSMLFLITICNILARQPVTTFFNILVIILHFHKTSSNKCVAQFILTCFLGDSHTKIVPKNPKLFSLEIWVKGVVVTNILCSKISVPTCGLTLLRQEVPCCVPAHSSAIIFPVDTRLTKYHKI